MLLHDLFTALHTPELPLPLLSESISSTDLLFAKKKIISSYRMFNDSKLSKAYDLFLVFCEQHLGQHETITLLDVVYHYLKSSNSTLDDINTCKKQTELFIYALQHQTNLLNIASMGRSLIDSPQTFAAFLRCLLLRDVMPEDILSTHLLQDYLRYYFGSLHAEHHEVSVLYSLLDAFSDTQTLASLAKETSCHEEGLLCYALDGTIKTSLSTVPFKSPTLLFTIDAFNLHHLYVLFDTTFFKGVLYAWPSQKDNPVFRVTIKELLNKNEIISEHLPELLSFVQSIDNPYLKEALVDILDKTSLKTLMDRHVVSLLTLLPFSSDLMALIEKQDLQPYLNALTQQAPSTLALVSSLFSLFEGLKKNKPDAAGLVVDTLLNALLQDPFALDDEPMLRKLRKFTPTATLIHEKAHALEEKLHTTILNNASKLMIDMDIILIQDLWQEVFSKIKTLQYIIPFNTSCPLDKYALYTEIALSYIKSSSQPFILDVFISSLTIEPLLDQQDITSFERMLLELLISIDHEPLRQACIDSLETQSHRPWKKNSSLFKRACESGNLGLIQKLRMEGLIPLESYDTLAIDAAQKGHWSIVDELNQHHLKQSTIHILLNLAVSSHAPEVLPQLWTQQSPHPNRKNIEQAFKLAVKNNDVKSVLFLMSQKEKISDSTLTHAFKQALILKNILALQAILDTPHGACLDAALNQAFLNAARTYDRDTLNTLRTCAPTYLTPKLIDNALIQSVRSNNKDSFLWISSLPEFTARPMLIDRIKREANKRAEMLPYVSAFIKSTSKGIVSSPTTAPKEKAQINMQVIKKAVSYTTFSPRQSSPRYTFFQPKAQTCHPSIKTNSLEL